MRTQNWSLEDWRDRRRTGWFGRWAPAIVLGLVVGLCGVSGAEEERPDKCEICLTNRLTDSYVSKDPIRDVKRFYCEVCYEAERCWACGLPVHAKTSRRLDDTRVLCHWDSQGIVVTQEEGDILFRKHLKDWQRVLSPWPPFPDGNLFLHMVNQADFLRAYRRRPHLESPELIRGLMLATVNEQGENEFHIYILTGLLRSQFLAVAAHEYAHTWLYEHEDRARQLHADTEEGFCEWIAFNYMVRLGDRIEQDRILRNAYTRGQVQALLASEKRYRAYGVIEWILHGVDSWLDEEEPRRLLALRSKGAAAQPAAPLISLAPGEPVVTPVPDTLTLKGISGSAKRRFALINNATLVEGEEAKVRVGEDRVKVKCLEIRSRSVLIQVEGEKEPKELQLGGQAAGQLSGESLDKGGDSK